MKLIKIVAVLVVAYAAMVGVFDLVISYVQPDMDIGVVLTTSDSQGQTSERMLAGFRLDDHLYVSANHWLRPWYYRALDNPVVEVTVGGERAAYTAVPITGPERDRVAENYRMGFVLRFITGFAPQRFLRLDPR